MTTFMDYSRLSTKWNNDDDDDHIRDKCYYILGFCEVQMTICIASDTNRKLQDRYH